MTNILAPENSSQLVDAVRSARADGTTLEVIAGGTRRGYGRPVDADAVLDVSGLTGVIDYDPAELVLTARPGTPMREISSLLASRGQHLAFEPTDQAPLWGGAGGAGTLGGALSVGLGGPRRPMAGGARDHFLGFEAVNGFGHLFSAGGKVIKNVTGYDLPKLAAGALGTLCVLSEVTVKVLPAPADVATLALEGLDDAVALRALAMALGSPAAVSGAVHLPYGADGLGDGPLTLLRLEGVPVSVAGRAASLQTLLTEVAPRARLIGGEESRRLWRDVGDLHPLQGSAEDVIWRVSLAPSAGAAFVAALPEGLGGRHFYDWGGGLVWLFLPAAEDGHAAAVRAALAGVSRDGHATLFRAAEAVRRAQPVFQPLEPGLAALSDRVKERFDPDRILNPGRFYGKV